MSDLIVKKSHGHREYTCGKCEGKADRNVVHDAFFCRSCKVWLEEVCDDPGCTECKGRPVSPCDGP